MPIDDTLMLNMVKSVVEKHGCKLIDVDFENHVLNIEGSEDAKYECALAIQKLFD